MSFFGISPEIYAYVILPLLIFLARICDVSMETIRVIYISRGIRYLAPVIAFFEIVIWLLAMEVVMQDLSNIANFMAFALGFAAGTYVGLVIEERLSIGMVILRVITTEESEGPITGFLAAENYGVTRLDAQGSRGSVRIILSLVNRGDIPRITDFIRTVNPRAFFSIEDVRYVNEGVFRQEGTGILAGISGSGFHRKNQ
ncbi:MULTISPECIES: DUF2179 domain-containing protein [unclassified Methanoregula]|uniref:DUF2179 domain-containing protein n=1 Tax=unclassified Methanoregula TaxID=2649730 RepID=UPI0009C4DB0B|nr:MULTISPECIES: DUF5698 domain-containing protein [unclassified Methanoregula]OPX63608.1 MAG: hypothetical protein A4E33_01543 [Methanoregula sp. PtaB.Bin085]OPY36226.1 MAG: hypothetical protein A4E34_00404 [Methanoregula sp. PtaU1.Bin006]